MFLIRMLLWPTFFGSALVLGLIILLQEPKGGGLAEAFGGQGAQTFGVRAGGINRATFIVAGIFIGSAILLHLL